MVFKSKRALRIHRRNLALLAVVEAFWGLGFPLINGVFIAPPFLRSLGASPQLIGTISGATFFLILICQTFSGYLTGHLRLKRNFITIMHAAAPTPFLLFGLYMYFMFPGMERAGEAIAFYIVTCILWGLLLGILVPAWVNFVGKVVIREKRGESLGTMFLLQNILAVGGFLIAREVLGSELSFAHRYGLLYGGAGLLLVTGNLPFLWVIEHRQKHVERSSSIAVHFRRMFGILRENPPFRTYVLLKAMSLSSFVLGAYMAVFYQDVFGFDETWIATMGVAMAPVQGFSAFFGGMAGDKFGYRKILIATATMGGIGLLSMAFAPAGWVFFVTATCLAFFMGAEFQAHAAITMRFNPGDDNTDYLSLAAFFNAPVVLVLPVVIGWLVGLLGYRPALGIAAAIPLVAALLIYRLVREPDRDEPVERGAPVTVEAVAPVHSSD